MRVKGQIVFLLLFALLLLWSCGSPPQPAALIEPRVLALLGDRRLLVIRPADGRILAEWRLVTPLPSDTNSPGQYMGLSRPGNRLFVLVPGPAGSADQLAVLDTETLAVTNIYPLSSTGVRFSSLAVGPVTGRVYLFGTRIEPQVQVAPDSAGTQALRGMVDVLDADRGTLIAEWPLRPSQGYDWQIYQGTVSDDERTLFVSYHGASTTGIDWFRIEAAGLVPCARPDRRANRGCIDAHGGFLLRNDYVLAATGTSRILAVDRSNAVQTTWDTHMERNHLMEFALDPMQNRMYVVGTCGYTYGFQSLALDAPPVPSSASSEPPPSPTPAAPREICGGRITLVSDTLLVTTKTAVTVVSAWGAGALLFVDARSGAIIRTVPTPSEPMDVLALRR